MSRKMYKKNTILVYNSNKDLRYGIHAVCTCMCVTRVLMAVLKIAVIYAKLLATTSAITYELLTRFMRASIGVNIIVRGH